MAEKENHKKITRVCIVDTVYALLIYLLFSSEQELSNTFYFFGDGVSETIRKRFPHHYYFDKKNKKFNSKWKLLFTIRLISYIRWPFLRKAQIYAQDHLFYSPYLVGYEKYTYIEDAPKIFSISQKGDSYKRMSFLKENKSLKANIMEKLIGPLYINKIANNISCHQIILTQEDDIPFSTKDKDIVILSLSRAWRLSSIVKQNYIMGIYDISMEDLNLLKKAKYILFTQCFYTDKILSEEEQVEMYKKILNKYPCEELVIKPHPRDYIDYEKYFPHIMLFNKPMPMQLFDLLDIKFIKAITISSSAVLSFSYDLEIDWIGNNVHPAIEKRYGEQKLEDFIK